MERKVRTGDSVVLRRLEADHLNAATEVYLAAFGTSRSGKLGRPYARAYLRWFVGEPTAIALGAWDAGELLGFAVGAPLGYQRSLNRDLAWTVARCVMMRPHLLADREILSALFGRLRVQFGQPRVPSEAVNVPAPIMCFVGAGLAAEARGLGIGARLYRGFQDECFARAAAGSIRGITHKDNTPPSRILANLGWQPLFEDAHGYVSWYKVLSPEPTTESLSSPDEPGKAGS